MSSFWQILPHWPAMASSGMGINMGVGHRGDWWGLDIGVEMVGVGHRGGDGGGWA